MHAACPRKRESVSLKACWLKGISLVVHLEQASIGRTLPRRVFPRLAALDRGVGTSAWRG